MDGDGVFFLVVDGGSMCGVSHSCHVCFGMESTASKGGVPFDGQEGDGVEGGNKKSLSFYSFISFDIVHCAPADGFHCLLVITEGNCR